jgi:hypothetical protein
MSVPVTPLPSVNQNSESKQTKERATPNVPHVPCPNVIEAVKIYGSQIKLGKHIGVSGPQISEYVRNNSAPKKIEMLCQFLVKEHKLGDSKIGVVVAPEAVMQALKPWVESNGGDFVPLKKGGK